MGLTGKNWYNFMVYCEDHSHKEMIHFDPDLFSKMKQELDIFYFTYFLPESVKSRNVN